MNITYDNAKDDANLAKHGVSLALVHKLEWALLLVKPDVRTDYCEPRMIGYAPIADRVYCVVFVDRDSAHEAFNRRIISLRKANTREVKAYVSQI